jgi:anti-anti-sigma regulatory factor
MGLPYTKHPRTGVVVIHLKRTFVGQAHILKKMVLSKLENGETHFQLDFSKTVEFDSAGLNTILTLSRKVGAFNCRFELVGLNEDLRGRFRMLEAGGLVNTAILSTHQ